MHPPSRNAVDGKSKPWTDGVPYPPPFAVHNKFVPQFCPFATNATHGNHGLSGANGQVRPLDTVWHCEEGRWLVGVFLIPA